VPNVKTLDIKEISKGIGVEFLNSALEQSENKG